MGGKKEESNRCEKILGDKRESEACQKKRWKSVKHPMLLKVEVPVWFSSPSPWQHCQQEKVEREKERWRKMV